ncbi:signal transduction histidine kinase [Curtobacterium herbarum]|uniref:sensor histidine kinase n=1 Tax=Curtobacterium herbarum TaxID=150122 RepID=UPI00209FB141|nr:HAMP domain-containing sensor histidine kinase [Curtobacterium herbarum]MCP1504165.1 signal transduction histidine kinase [Curtobacterium herbarum]
MSRVWSLRTRTALAFAVTSMALTAAAIVFVTLGSQHAIAEVVVADAAGGVAISPDASGGPRRATGPAPDGAAAPGGIAIVSRVAALQWQWSALGIAGAGVVAGLTGWLLSRRMLAPLDRIAGTAERISASTLHERIDLRGPDDELRRLSRTIDGLLDRLETAFASQRRFVAQASHELRTPIAVQRAAIQIGLHDDADAVDVARARAELLEQNRRTEHLVESLLVLAEAERGLDGRTADVDLGVLAGAVVDEAQAAAREAGVRLRCTVLGVGVGVGVGVGAVRCEPVLTRQLVHNLVDNAIEYNVPGGHVDVEVDGTVLRVRNTGPELDDALVPTLTEPFRRVSAAAGGRRHSGLGLSIVEAVAQAHGWRVSLAARPGGGLVAEVDVSPR